MIKYYKRMIRENAFSPGIEVYTWLANSEADLGLILDTNSGYDHGKNDGKIEFCMYREALEQNQVDNLLTISNWEI